MPPKEQQNQIPTPGLPTQADEIKELIGYVTVKTSIPTFKPVKFIDHFQIYIGAPENRLYIYDAINKTWRFIKFDV